MQDQNQPKNQQAASDATVPQVSVNQDQPVSQKQETDSQAAVNQAPQTAVKNKEGEPVAMPVSESFSAVAESLEISHAPTPEVNIPEKLGHVIEAGPDGKELTLSKEVSAALATPTKEPMPEIRTPTGVIRLPKTYAQALHEKNITKIDDSPHWLAAVIMYLWKKYG